MQIDTQHTCDSKINFRIGDATAPEGQGAKVIVHVCLLMPH